MRGQSRPREWARIKDGKRWGGGASSAAWDDGGSELVTSRGAAGRGGRGGDHRDVHAAVVPRVAARGGPAGPEALAATFLNIECKSAEVPRFLAHVLLRTFRFRIWTRFSLIPRGTSSVITDNSEACLEYHSFETLSRKALDLEATLANAQPSQSDTKKKKSPQEWKKKGAKLMMVESDGTQTEIDELTYLMDYSEYDGEETAEGSTLAAVVRAKAGGRVKGQPKSQGKAASNQTKVADWVKAVASMLTFYFDDDAGSMLRRWMDTGFWLALVRYGGALLAIHAGWLALVYLVRKKEERQRAQQEEAEQLGHRLLERLQESSIRRQMYLEQRHEAASIERLKFWHFEPSNGDDATPEEQHKEFLSKLVTRLLYTCNYQQSELERQNQELQQQYQDLKTHHQELANLRRIVQSHEDATQALNSCVLDLEQAVPGPDAGESSSAPSNRQLEQRVDHVVAMLRDINTFAAPTTINNQLDTLKTEVQQLQSTNTDGNNPKQYKMPTFQLEKFDDYMHQDPVLWWEAFTTQLRILPVAKHAYIGALFMNSKGGCQIWLTHLEATHGVDVADLKDKITWEELTRLWKKRFIVDDAPTLAINRLFTTTQGNTATRDWLTEWQKIKATPDLDLPFPHLRCEFYNRSCAALSQALGDREQYATFAEIIDKAREIIKTNRAAAHERSTWQPTYVEKVKTGPRPQHVAAVESDSGEDPAAAQASREGDQVAVVQPRSNKKSRANGKAKSASPTGNGQPAPPWVKFGLTEAEYKYRGRYGCSYWCNGTKHKTSLCEDQAKEDARPRRSAEFAPGKGYTLLLQCRSINNPVIGWQASESGTKMKPSSARHPQTDGQTDRAHQTAQMMLRTLIRPDQKDWVDRLLDIKFAYNTSVHLTIGMTPFELHHGGRKGRIFADLLLPRPADIDAACSPASVRKYRELLAQAHANMQKAQVRMQQQANRHRVPCPIRADDLVWVSAEEFALEQDVSRKLLPKWFGPWPVTSAAGDEPDGPSFVINIPPHLMVHPVFHASKLATYTPGKSDDFPGRRSQDPPMDGHQEVDRVITDRKYGSKPRQYKVTFKACDRDDTRWISGADLKASAPLIYAHYEKQRASTASLRSRFIVATHSLREGQGVEGLSCEGSRARMVAKVEVERGHASGRADDVVIGNLGGCEQLIPVVLVWMAILPQDSLESIVDLLGLSIGLGVECSARLERGSICFEDVFPELGEEAGITITDDVSGEAVMACDMIEEEGGDVFGTARSRARNEVGTFGQAADNDVDAIMPAYGSNGEVEGVSDDIEMASGVGDLEDRGRGDGLLDGDNVAEVFDARSGKRKFAELGVEFLLSEDREDLANMLEVGLEGGAKDEDIVKIHDDTDFEEVTEDVIHGGLECGGGIGESERHYEELIVPELRAECRLVGVLADTDLVEATTKVNLGEIFGSTKSIKGLGDPR
ncbi:hypothetical protein CBR_g23196 [Chara braunii]|uniref:Integrase catalytic domain-containing protein n=1 Tax=Chara braunii TaxID=69332 RepID=A0A388JV76_CHABU|nr:hypothetical protein CBR_g23196 [Chara braunii]|eukprot:GBG61680.1 hypothetical protein CBR_g23196 [Chara braunii]